MKQSLKNVIKKRDKIRKEQIEDMQFEDHPYVVSYDIHLGGNNFKKHCPSLDEYDGMTEDDD